MKGVRGFSFHNCDLGDRARGARSRTRNPFDRIYHLAAAVGVDLVLKDPIGSIRTNIVQTDRAARSSRSAAWRPSDIHRFLV